MSYEQLSIIAHIEGTLELVHALDVGLAAVAEEDEEPAPPGAEPEGVGPGQVGVEVA